MRYPEAVAEGLAVATITIDDDVYQRLTLRAARMGVSVNDLVTPILDANSREPEPPKILTGEERLKAFQAWSEAIAARADRYPPGFQVDDSREAMYAERLDAQMGPPS